MAPVVYSAIYLLLCDGVNSSQLVILCYCVYHPWGIPDGSTLYCSEDMEHEVIKQRYNITASTFFVCHLL